MTQPPHAEYTARRDDRLAQAARQDRVELYLSGARLVLAILAAALAWLAFGRGALSGWWLAAPVLVFAAVAVAHDRVIRRRRRLLRAADFYARGLARLEHRWAGTGEGGSRFLATGHPYAADLDLFGEGSIFELLCTARTRAGEETLASWLLAPASRAEVLARQEAVRELTPRLDLREEMALLGSEVRAGVHPDELIAWGAEAPVLTSRSFFWFGAALSSLTLAGLTAWGLGWSGPTPFVAAAALQSGVALWLRSRVLHVLAGAEAAARDLALLSQVLARIESEAVVSPRLVLLVEALQTGGAPPSRRIARLNALVERLDSRRNQLFTPVAAALFWGTQIAHALERWRAHSGAAVAAWLHAAGEYEALCALASFGFENPADPFPELIDPRSDPDLVFDGRKLGHPLIPIDHCVRNDVRLARSGPAVLLVTGSNMSGKSTLLRTVGVNAVLAMAGAPVRAGALQLPTLRVGASIRTQDSLQAGTSRFYAEITRLRQIVDLTAGALPVLFLMDELLHGTNSHDRSIGAEGVVRGLVSRGAVGLVTTHDLALAKIVEALAPRAAVVHFEDHLEGGRISFDYVMRPGVVRKSNALELMRSVGLEI